MMGNKIISYLLFFGLVLSVAFHTTCSSSSSISADPLPESVLEEYKTLLVNVTSSILDTSVRPKEMAADLKTLEGAIIRLLEKKTRFENIYRGSDSKDKETDLRLDAKIVDLSKRDYGSRMLQTKSSFAKQNEGITVDVSLVDVRSGKVIGTFEASYYTSQTVRGKRPVDVVADQIVGFVRRKGILSK